MKRSPRFIYKLPVKHPTKRQLEILQLVAKDKRYKDVAGELGLSVRTVKNHMLDLRERLDIHSISHAVYLGMKNGWIK